MTEPTLDLLIVDDDDLTAEGLQRSLSKIGGIFRVIPAEDGLEALEILRGRSKKRIERPFLVLLDLNMPRMNGFEFLHALRADPELRATLVFVLSTSGSDIDRARAYDENIAGYMVKARLGPQLKGLADFLRDFSSIVLLP